MGNLTFFDGSVILVRWRHIMVTNTNGMSQVAFKVIRTDLDADLFKYYEVYLGSKTNLRCSIHNLRSGWTGKQMSGRPLNTRIFFRFSVSTTSAARCRC